MALHFGIYGSEAEADKYFRNRLHSTGWFKQSPEDRRKAILAATRVIDALNYSGDKLDPDQGLQFPRTFRRPKTKKRRGFGFGLGKNIGSVDICCCPDEDQEPESTEVPCEIVQAAYEIGYEILVNCRDAELELESLGISSQGLSSVRTTYARSQVPIDHIVAGIPSVAAWRLLRPFLSSDDAIRLKLA